MELEKKHILIVDDDTRICDLLEKFLDKKWLSGVGCS